MKPQYIVLFLLNLNLYCFSQKVVVGLVNGSWVAGNLISISTTQIVVDPEGSVQMLTLFAPEIQTLKFEGEGLTILYPITESNIPAKLVHKKNRNIGQLKGTYYDNYFGLYLFGGFSTKHTLNFYNGSPYVVQPVYQNSGLGGFGAEYMSNHQNLKSEFIFELEMSIVDTKILNNVNRENLTGYTLYIDMDVNYFPLQANGGKYPKPFVFCGLGLQSISLQTPDGSVNVFEDFVGIPFGLGFRLQISKNISFQIKERFITTKLENVDKFILPETRFELHFTAGKW